MVEYDGLCHYGITQCVKVWSMVKSPTIEKPKAYKKIRNESTKVSKVIKGS